MPVERGDSDAPVGGTSTDVPSTFEQSTLKGTTSTGGARLIVRDATQIQVIDTGAKFLATTVEAVLAEIDARIYLVENEGATLWGNLIGTLSDQTDLQTELTTLDSAVTTVSDDLATETSSRIAADALKLNLTGGTLTGEIHFPDNVSILLGTGDDAGIYYNGNDLYLNPKLVGTGGVEVLGTVSSNVQPTLAQHLTRKDYVDNAVVSFDSGTLMLFQQTAAPTGWTKQTTHNDKALRVVSGTVGSGGSSAFSTVFGKTATNSTTLTSTQMPSHKHSHGTRTGSNVPRLYGDWTTTSAIGNQSVSGATIVPWSSNTGSSGGHSHAMDIRVQYVDLIIASKD